MTRGVRFELATAKLESTTIAARLDCFDPKRNAKALFYTPEQRDTLRPEGEVAQSTVRGTMVVMEVRQPGGETTTYPRSAQFPKPKMPLLDFSNPHIKSHCSDLHRDRAILAIKRDICLGEIWKAIQNEKLSLGDAVRLVRPTIGVIDVSRIDNHYTRKGAGRHEAWRKTMATLRLVTAPDGSQEMVSGYDQQRRQQRRSMEKLRLLVGVDGVSEMGSGYDQKKRKWRQSKDKLRPVTMPDGSQKMISGHEQERQTKDKLWKKKKIEEDGRGREEELSAAAIQAYGDGARVVKASRRFGAPAPWALVASKAATSVYSVIYNGVLPTQRSYLKTMGVLQYEVRKRVEEAKAAKAAASAPFASYLAELGKVAKTTHEKKAKVNNDIRKMSDADLQPLRDAIKANGPATPYLTPAVKAMDASTAANDMDWGTLVQVASTTDKYVAPAARNEIAGRLLDESLAALRKERGHAGWSLERKATFMDQHIAAAVKKLPPAAVVPRLNNLRSVHNSTTSHYKYRQKYRPFPKAATKDAFDTISEITGTVGCAFYLSVSINKREAPY